MHQVLLLLWTARVGLSSAFDIKVAHSAATSAALLLSALLTPQHEVVKNWELMNGSVRLNDPIVLSIQGKTLQLSNPTLIGAGGGGAVFAMEDSSILLKVSWTDSTKSVHRECRTLQLLEQKNVGSAERCLGEFAYDGDDEGRVVIAVEPYVRDAVAAVSEVDKRQQRIAVEQIARTVVQMLAANIVTIDVQPLIDKHTGNVIFIDMTEAQELIPPFSFLDKVLLGSFATEMLTLIPENLVDVASQTMMKEIAALKAEGVSLSDEANEVLYSQTLFFPE